MKKLLLIAIFLYSAIGLHAQSKSTGVVNLLAGMTAKLDLNNTTSTATLTFTGPADRWYALQIGSFGSAGGMQDGQDVVYATSTGLVDAVHNGVGVTPSTDGSNNWNVTSNTVAGTTRTIIATRPFSTGDANDYTFVYSDANIDFAYAKSQTASYTLAYHGAGNKGYALNKAFSCIPPGTPTASAQQFCAGATVSNLQATGAAGATFNWYANSAGGSALAGTTALSNTTYYVSQTVDACESARIPVTVTVTTVAQPSTSTTQQFCSGATVANLNATGAGTINWYNVAAGGSPLTGATVLTTGNYYISQTIGACESTRAIVAVNIINLEAPTTDDNTQEFCGGSNVFNLVATASNGASIQWFADSTGGEPLDGYTVLTDGTTYFAEQTLGECVSGSRLPVTVSVNTIALPTTDDDTQTFCEGATLADLDYDNINGAQVNVRMTLGGEILPGTTVIENGTIYNVSQVVDGCESSPLQITATVNPVPATPNAAEEQDFTEGETIADLEITTENGATVTWYHMVGTDMVEVGTDTMLEDGEMYHVTQTINSCESEMRTITVNEILSATEFELKNLTAYPNPASDILTISNNSMLSEISVYNLIGQKLLTQKAVGTNAEVNVSKLPAGSYIVKVITVKGSSASLKIMKQ